MSEVSVEMRHANLVISKIAKSLLDAKVLNRIGGEVANEARNNAYERPGRSFWRNMGQSVSMQKKGQGVIVGAAHEAAAQKQFGGPIEAPGQGPDALKAKALTIPLGVARNRRWNTRDASVKYDLFLVKSGGKSILFGKLKGRVKMTRANTKPLFLLKKRVMQQADPWFPEGEQLKRAISRGIEDYRKIAGGF